MARKAEVIFVGDASSIVRASAEAKGAIDSVSSSSTKTSVSVGGMSRTMKTLVAAATSVAPALAGVAAVGIGAGVAMAGVAASVGTLVVGFKELEATHSGFAKQVKATQAEFQKMMGQAAEPLLKPMEQALQQVGKLEPALHSLFSGAAKLIQPLSSGILEVAKVGLPQLGNVIKASSGLIKPLADGFASLIKTLGPAFTQTIREMQPIMAPLIKGLGGMLGGLMTGVNVMLKAVGPAIKPLANVFAQIGKVVGNVFVALAPALRPATQVLSVLLGIIGTVLTTFGKIADQLAVALAPSFRQLAKIVDQVVAALMPFIKTILTDLGNLLAQIAPLLLNFVTQLVKNLAPFLPVILKAFTDLVKLGLKALMSALRELLPDLLKVITALVKNLAPILPQLVRLLGQLVMIGVKVLSKALVELTPLLLKLINSVLPPLMPALKQLMPLFAKAASVIGEVLVRAIDVATPIIKGLIDVIGFVVKAVGDLDKSDVWTQVFDTIASPFESAANAVISFIDDIIGAINKIPGVHIALVPKLGAGSHGPANANQVNAATGVGQYAVGGKITQPMFMVGEEAPQHHEYVLATNPAYRNRNLGLWAQAGKDLGVPGFALGGVVSGIGHDISSAASSVGHFASSLLSKGASAITGLLPGIGSLPSWLGGMGKTVLGDVTSWIKDKVGSVVKSIGSALGFGGGGGGSVAPGSWTQVATELAKQHGWGPEQIQAWKGVEAAEDGSYSLTATNPQSGAYGLAQMLGTPDGVGPAKAKYYSYGGNPNTLVGQLTAMANYIADTYGTPANALAHENTFHWYAKGGTPGLKQDESKISAAFKKLNALMGPSGDYNTAAEKLSYYPSLWQVTNPLLGSSASSFINPDGSVNATALNLTSSEENQELGWYGSQISDIKKAMPIAQNVAAVIRDAIPRLQLEVWVAKKKFGKIIADLKAQIAANLRAIAALQKKINAARAAKEPYPNPKNHAQSVANSNFRQHQHDLIYGADGNGGYMGQIHSLEMQNKVLGGTSTTVGTGGRIGAASKQLSATAAAIQKRITSMRSNLSNVTGSGSFSPLTLAGITGFGGELGPALIQQATLQAQLASISPAAMTAAQSANAGTGTGVTASPIMIVGPTTTQELAALLSGMPALAPGGGRAQGGPVLPGYVYRVGEKGPEDVAFGAPGHVMTAAQTRGGAMMHIEHAHFSGATAAKATVDRLAFRAAIGVA